MQTGNPRIYDAAVTIPAVGDAPVNQVGQMINTGEVQQPGEGACPNHGRQGRAVQRDSLIDAPAAVRAVDVAQHGFRRNSFPRLPRTIQTAQRMKRYAVEEVHPAAESHRANAETTTIVVIDIHPGRCPGRTLQDYNPRRRELFLRAARDALLGLVDERDGRQQQRDRSEHDREHAVVVLALEATLLVGLHVHDVVRMQDEIRRGKEFPRMQVDVVVGLATGAVADHEHAVAHAEHGQVAGHGQGFGQGDAFVLHVEHAGMRHLPDHGYFEITQAQLHGGAHEILLQPVADRVARRVGMQARHFHRADERDLDLALGVYEVAAHHRSLVVGLLGIVEVLARLRTGTGYINVEDVVRTDDRAIGRIDRADHGVLFGRLKYQDALVRSTSRKDRQQDDQRKEVPQQLFHEFRRPVPWAKGCLLAWG